MNTEAIMSARMMFYGDPSFRATSMWVTLKEDPDLQQLQEAVDAAVRIHPWAAYGIREADGMFYYSDHLSDSIQIAPLEDADPPALGGDDAQGHLLGVFYRGRRLYFSFFHGLTDGTGIISFVDTCLRCYRALRDGEHFEQERQDYADAEAEPLTRVSQAMQEAGISDDALAGGGTDLPQVDYADHGQMLSSGAEPCKFLIRADADDMMHFVEDMGVKISASLVALYASAFLKVHPETAGSLRIALPVDYRNVLGIPHTFRNCAMPPAMFNIEVRQGETIREMAGRINQSILQLTSPAVELLTIKGFASYMKMLPPLPYAQTAGLMAQALTYDHPPFTFNCSYAHRFQDEEYLGLVDSIYVLTPAFGSAPVFEVVALPDHFCIAMSQGGCNEVYLQAYMDELKMCGIHAVHEETITGAGQYVALRETLGL